MERFCCTERQKHRQLPGEGPHWEKVRREQQSESEKILCFFVDKYLLSIKGNSSSPLPWSPLSPDRTSINGTVCSPPDVFLSNESPAVGLRHRHA